MHYSVQCVKVLKFAHTCLVDMYLPPMCNASPPKRNRLEPFKTSLKFGAVPNIVGVIVKRCVVCVELLHRQFLCRSKNKSWFCNKNNSDENEEAKGGVVNGYSCSQN